MTRKENKEAALAMIMAAAFAGERCPQNDSVPGGTSTIGGLVLTGHIRVEVFAKNYRVVTLLTGYMAGRSTAPPPGAKLKPYLIMDASGSRRNRRPVDRRSVRVSLPFKDGRRT